MTDNVYAGNLAKVLYYYGFIPDTCREKYQIVCPFHNDINPSLTADINSGEWYCFGCATGGNALDFVIKLCRIKYPEWDELRACLEYVRVLKSNKVSKIVIEHVKKRKEESKESLLIAKDYYYGLSRVDWNSVQDKDQKEALQYMLDRGIKTDTLNYFGMRYNYREYYPLIFPIMDNRDFKGWVCRTNNKKAESWAKYLYNTGFSRATTLCGHYSRGKPLVVVEGFIDMVKMRQFGLINVVALLGWKMSSEQLQKIKKNDIPYIICALDNDECGKRGFDYLKTVYRVYRWRYLKGIKDAGDMTEETFTKMYIKTKKAITEERRNGND